MQPRFSKLHDRAVYLCASTLLYSKFVPWKLEAPETTFPPCNNSMRPWANNSLLNNFSAMKLKGRIIFPLPFCSAVLSLWCCCFHFALFAFWSLLSLKEELCTCWTARSCGCVGRLPHRTLPTMHGVACHWAAVNGHRPVGPNLAHPASPGAAPDHIGLVGSRNTFPPTPQSLP